jgi:hypothetical protein
MNKQYISYGIIGIVAGLVLGFFVGNMVSKPAAGSAPVSAGAQGSASVNSSGGGAQELPPGHPPVDPNQPTPAPPLAEGQGGSAGQGNTSQPPAAATASFPSLDPAPAGSSEKRVEQTRKNIQILRGLPDDRLMPVMNAFRSALGVNCTYCHVSQDQPEKDDKPEKQRAREMIKMTRDLNARLGGGQKVTCNTCHRGQAIPPK